MHIGDVHGGHYCAFIKPSIDSKWFKFDDDRVIPVSEREVFEDNFGDGGDLAQQDHPIQQHPHHRQTPLANRKTYKHLTNAYMLVYIRNCDRDWILAPVLNPDVPAHLSRIALVPNVLASVIMREQEERERADKERADRHLYIALRVVMRQHLSLHHVCALDLFILSAQGHDLIDWDAPNTEFVHLNLKRDTPWSEVKVVADSLSE